MKRTTIVMLLVVSSQTGAFAAASFLPYEGRLTDASGAAVSDGTYEIRFRLYTSPAQDAEEICVDVLPNSCWWEESQLVETQGGFFTAQLGSLEPFPQGMFNFDELWLGVRVSTKQCETSGAGCSIDEDCGPGEACIWVQDSEMTPRQELGGTPYAEREVSESVVLMGVYSSVGFQQHPPWPPPCPEPDTYSVDLTWTDPPDLLEVLIVGTAGEGTFTPYIVDDMEVACDNLESSPLYVESSQRYVFTYGLRGRYHIIPSNPSSVVCLGGGGSESHMSVRGGAMPSGWYDDGFELRLDGCSYQDSGHFKILVFGHYDRKFDTTPYIPPGG